MLAWGRGCQASHQPLCDEVHRQAVGRARQEQGRQGEGRPRTRLNPQAQTRAHEDGLQPVSDLIALELDVMVTHRSPGPLVWSES